MTPSSKAASRGEPAYILRPGGKRRLQLIEQALVGLECSRLLDDGCGVGAYLNSLGDYAAEVYGLDYELERLQQAKSRGSQIPPLICAAAEEIPFLSESFDAVISNEVIEHVADDQLAVQEMVRVLKVGGRAVIFCPNRWYPVEQHGIFWRGKYHFGNIPLVNYLPDPLRDRLAPHVRIYTAKKLLGLLHGLPVRVVSRTRIFGGYDNLVARFGRLGRLLRCMVHLAERTPLRIAGLSHLVIIERVR
ncbi:MAG: class I SAM-dependent methyltransferase [Candidatus Dormibacteraceae bacterium]